MTRVYQVPPGWKPPSKMVASAAYAGEESTSVIHEAVGRALGTWEHAESALIKLYQLLCETKSLAACRAYGTTESVFAGKPVITLNKPLFGLLDEEYLR